jgi:hypothetical protein
LSILLDMSQLRRPPQEQNLEKEKSQSDSKGSSLEFRRSQKLTIRILYSAFIVQ